MKLDKLISILQELFSDCGNLEVEFYKDTDDGYLELEVPEIIHKHRIYGSCVQFTFPYD